jgi:hypothetical protein
MGSIPDPFSRLIVGLEPSQSSSSQPEAEADASWTCHGRRSAEFEEEFEAEARHGQIHPFEC